MGFFVGVPLGISVLGISTGEGEGLLVGASEGRNSGYPVKIGWPTAAKMF
jgi:hypothetical protein